MINAKNTSTTIIFIISCFCVFESCKLETASIEKFDDPINSVRIMEEPIKAISKPQNLNKDKVTLGRLLFHDTRLSSDNTISCASCHNLKTGGVDKLITSVGVRGKIGTVNAPSIFNAANNFRQFWDGRAINLFDQIDGPINNELEHGSNWEEIVSKLLEDKEYKGRFNDLFDDGITKENIKNCIVEFEKSLITPSAFDRYLQGDESAINRMEREGYQLFKSYGCISCHQGANVGGNMYQKFGIMDDYFNDRGDTKISDYGRFNVTGNEADRYYFKVPSLRNVALTAPYFHDGKTKTLSEAVKIMAKYQIGRTIPEEEVGKIVLFLNTLTGDSL